MLCFIHIERAGGTTLHHILRSNYASFLTLAPQLWTNDPGAVFTADELRAMLRVLPFTRGFGGHTTRVYAGYESAAPQPLHYFTFVRDPIQRYLSQFHYQVDRMGIPWSLDAFLDEPRFSNFMTTRIAGAPDVRRAKALLRDRFSFVGLTEQFDESLLLMRRALLLPDFDVRYERKNSAVRKRPVMEEALTFSPDRLKDIESRNELDLELYEFASKTLYPEYVERYGGELSRELERFRHENEQFRFGRRKRTAWRVYRKTVYQPIEALVRTRYRSSAVLPPWS